ncbi:MAG: histidine kinase [Pyrinomonadaceae bacterium]
MNLTEQENVLFGVEVPTTGKRLWERRGVRWAVVFGVWTMLAVFFTGQLYYTYVLTDKPMSWRAAASEQFLYPYLWAVGTIIVLRLASRFPLEGKGWPRHLLLHLLFATIFAVVISGAFQMLYHFLFVNSAAKPYSPVATLRWIIFNSSENYGIYGLVLLLNHAFRYYKRFREGELKASQLEAQLSHAQLQALKMQLHPHFLFNTLHSISALVHADPDAADRMIARLGDFLRLTLENAGAQEVTLQRELEFLKCYLEIERIRFRDRLTTHLEIEAQTLDAQVPNLILQPIVENALRYAVAPRSAPGRIEISAKRNDGSLRIEVRDDGPGMPEASGDGSGFKEGLGLANTRARLERLYGAAHRFELTNATGGGLIVMLEIPAA